MERKVVSPSREPLKVLCFDFTSYAPWLQFVCLVVGVFLGGCLFSIMHEQAFNTALREVPVVLGFFIFLTSAFIAFVDYVRILLATKPSSDDYDLQTGQSREIQTFLGDSVSVSELVDYSLIGCVAVMSIACANLSLQYLNYPTQVVFKSSKLIPVMIGGVLIQGKHYSFLEYIASIMICIGVALFSLANYSGSADFNVMGIVIICISLTGDAAMGNLQERAMRVHKKISSKMILYSKAVGSFLMLMWCILGGQIFRFLELVTAQEGLQLFAVVISFAVSNVFGEFFTVGMVRRFGALVAVTVTSCRKVVTIVLSFLLFPKIFTAGYLLGGILVLGGISLSTWVNRANGKK